MWLSKRCYVKVFVDGVVMCLFLRFPEGGEEEDSKGGGGQKEEERRGKGGEIILPRESMC